MAGVNRRLSSTKQDVLRSSLPCILPSYQRMPSADEGGDPYSWGYKELPDTYYESKYDNG
jgi:hypothetical protein